VTEQTIAVLRKGLGHRSSVAVAAHRQSGIAAMERWLGSEDEDVRWVMRKNLGKARLARMDAAWVAEASREMQRRQ
jgi:hypothetical protein